MIRDLIVQTPYRPGERLPPEREIAERLNVTRTVVREALIMLEIKGLVEVRRGAGIYVLDSADNNEMEGADVNHCNDAGPFELVSCWKAISLNLPLCRPPAKTSLKCARRYNWKSESSPPARRAAQKAAICSFIWPLPKRPITVCW